MIYITINLMKKKQKLFNKKNKNIFENNLLKTLYQFFITVYFFHSYPTKKYKTKKGISFFFIKSKKEANSKNLTEDYFKNNKFKLERFKNKSRFIGIKNKQEIICSGWIHYGTQSRWNVEEINRDIKLNNQYLLYDFYTSKKFRNFAEICQIMDSLYHEDIAPVNDRIKAYLEVFVRLNVATVLKPREEE